MADILPLHGSGRGAWGWGDVIPAPGAQRHRLRAIDLPGHGAGRTPIAELALERCARSILARLLSDIARRPR